MAGAVFMGILELARCGNYVHLDAGVCRQIAACSACTRRSIAI